MSEPSSRAAPSGVVRPWRTTSRSELAPADLLQLEEWEQFYRECWGPLVRYANWLLHDQHLAEDLVQDSFLKLWKKWPQHRNWYQKRLAYSKRTVHNTVRDYWKLKERQTVVDGDLVNRELENGTDRHLPFDPDTLQKAMKLLPRRQREVICLRYMNGMEPAEVAEYLNVSADMVYKWTYLALSNMRKQFKR